MSSRSILLALLRIILLIGIGLFLGYKLGAKDQYDKGMLDMTHICAEHIRNHYIRKIQ